MDKVQKFKELYDEVFDKHGAVKRCGRQKCIELMTIASEIKPGVEFGDMESGFMKTANLKSLRSELE